MCSDLGSVQKKCAHAQEPKVKGRRWILKVGGKTLVARSQLWIVSLFSLSLSFPANE